MSPSSLNDPAAPRVAARRPSLARLLTAVSVFVHTVPTPTPPRIATERRRAPLVKGTSTIARAETPAAEAVSVTSFLPTSRSLSDLPKLIRPSPSAAYSPISQQTRCHHFPLRPLPFAPCCSRSMQPVVALVHPVLRAGWTCSMHRSHSRPFHWARLRGNSCALQLRVFCFTVSSQKISGNNAEDFLCPARNADPRLGSSPHSLNQCPITRAENGGTKSCTKTKSNSSGISVKPGAQNHEEDGPHVYDAFTRNTERVERCKRRVAAKG